MTPPNLPLRDQLALDRTDLANRRTWLAYARTAMALFVAGASFLHFFGSTWMDVAGVLFLIAALPTVAIGWRHYRVEEQRLAVLEAEARGRLMAPPDRTSPPHTP